MTDVPDDPHLSHADEDCPGPWRFDYRRGQAAIYCSCGARHAGTLDAIAAMLKENLRGVQLDALANQEREDPR